MLVGQIINGPNNDGDFDIKFTERSCKIKHGFVFSEIEDLAFVKRSDVVCKLANQLHSCCSQGRRKKFRVPGQKFRLNPLVSSAPNHVMSKKSHSVRRSSNFGPKSSDEQNKVIASADVRISAQNKKKTSSRPQAVV